MSLAAVLAVAGALGAAEFDDLATGFTIYYRRFGAPGGAEMYLPGQRARWMAPDGSCVDGKWFEADGQICFDYEDYGPPMCWIVTQTTRGGLLAVEEGASPDSGFEEIARDRRPLPCIGPDLGV